MEIKQDLSKTHAIFCHDGYEFTIRCLKRAIDILETEQSVDKDDADDTLVYPLGKAIDILRDKIWQEFDAMCIQKADYDHKEWMKMKEEHNKKIKEQNQEQKQT